MTIGNFDSYSQFNLLAYVPDTGIYKSSPNGSDTFNAQLSSNFPSPVLDDISLVRDTTQPMISLSEFSLGPDTTVCSGTTIGGQPYFLSYLWNTGDTTRLLHVTQSGQYWCRASTSTPTRP